MQQYPQPEQQQFAQQPPSAPQDQTKRNVMAIVGLVLGISSVTICCPVLGLSLLVAIAGVVLSAIGLKQIKQQPETYSGKGIALAGLIVSGVAAFLALVLMIVGIYFYLDYQEEERRSRTRFDMYPIMNAAEDYRRENPTQPCPTVQILESAGELRSYHETQDAWGNDFIIECQGERRVNVISAGPDGIRGSSDDIRRSGYGF